MDRRMLGSAHDYPVSFDAKVVDGAVIVHTLPVVQYNF